MQTGSRARARSVTASTVEIVVPVHNEASSLEASVRRLCAYLAESFPFQSRVTIADNASTDDTLAIAGRIADEIGNVSVRHIAETGRGRALKSCWLDSEADVVVYMDVDLSTGLEALLPLVAPLVTGHSDLAIGTRLANGSRVVRGPRREVISRLYNALLHAVLRNKFSDAQCGFKAMRVDVARVLLPLVQDGAWFFDTELLVLAERNGLRIHEVPVDWIDDPDSRVRVVATALADLKGVWRMSRQFLHGGGFVHGGGIVETERPRGLREDFTRFASVGTASTVAWAALTAGLRPVTGLLLANIVALSVCASANLGVHRLLNVRAPRRPDRDLSFVALGSFAAAVGATTLALMAAGTFTSLLVVELAAALAAGAVVSVARFVVLRALLVARAGRPETAGILPGDRRAANATATGHLLRTERLPEPDRAIAR